MDPPVEPTPPPETIGTPPGPTTQELRLAIVLTGGVSLSVWMGGVCREIDLLNQASDAACPAPATLTQGERLARTLYQRLLGLLNVRVSLDVLSGTSAGGINAAVLGLANARRRDTGSMRDLWTHAGAFDQLLRDPRRPDPPSLLRGDEYLLGKLTAGIAAIAGEPVADPRPTHVFITTTLLSPEISRFTDSYGTVIADADHHGLFHFTDDLLGGAAAAQLAPPLALAARSGAAFPVAFEPAFVPCGSAADAAHPDMSAHANVTGPHWAADGSLLVNRPIAPLLQEVFDRPASGQVRRVLLYVVPSSRPIAASTPDRLDKPPNLGEALLKDLSATLNQSIAADLAAICEHNDRVAAVSETRLRLASLGVRLDRSRPDPVEAGTTVLTDLPTWRDYRRRQAEWLVRPLVASVLRQVVADPVLSARWPGGLGPGSDVEQRLRAVASAEVIRDWPLAPPQSPPEALRAAGCLGRTAFDAAKATILDILRSGYALADTPEARVQLATCDRRVHEAFTPPRETDLRAFVATRLAGSKAPETLDEVVARVTGDYVRGPEAGTGGTPQVAQPGVAGSGVTGSGVTGPGVSGLGAVQTLQAAWPALAGALIDVRDLLAGLVDRAPASPPEPAGAPVGAGPAGAGLAGAGSVGAGLAGAGLADAELAGDEPAGPPGRHSLLWRRAEAAHRIRTYLGFLQARDVARTVARLLDLHVAERSVLPVGVDVQQPVELVQLSADTRSLLDPARHTAEDKLTGMQLHHFGAFFKASWRANDWMWGRLDGAGWLIHLLLDPRRILSVVEDAGIEPADRADWFLGRIEEIVGAAPLTCLDGSSPTRSQLLDELAFLGSEAAPLPASLPTVSRWAARRSQESIAADELACVARHLRDGVEGNPGRAEREWLARYDAVAPGDAAAAAALLPSCPVSQQRLKDREQAVSPLFIRTLTQAVAVVAAAATAATSPPPFLRPTFATARSVTRIAYIATDKMHGFRARVLLVGIALAAFGTLAMATQNLVLGVSGLALIGAGTVMLSVALWRAVPTILAAIVTVVMLLIAAAPWLPWLDDWLFSWLQRSGMPWLREQRWPWTVLFLLVILPPLQALIRLAGQWLSRVAFIRRSRVAGAPGRPAGRVARTGGSQDGWSGRLVRMVGQGGWVRRGRGRRRG
jgi:patatin-related protein